MTFDYCRRLVDRFVLVEEADIADGILSLCQKESMLVEGGAALPLAVLRQERARFLGRRVVLVVSGRRIDPARAQEIGCDRDLDHSS